MSRCFCLTPGPGSSHVEKYLPVQVQVLSLGHYLRSNVRHGEITNPRGPVDFDVFPED